MRRARYLVVGLVLAVLLAAAGVGFAYGQMGSGSGGDADGRSDSATDETGTDPMMSGQMGSMMDHGGEDEGHMMGSFNEERPFDLQFIDQMIIHHQGAIMSSEHMIADSERPELRQLAENIQKSQAEQIEQMQAWREEWYGDAEQTSGMMDPAQMHEMMGGSMQEMMSEDATDAMFLRMMIPHHQLAVDMSERALEEAEHPELKELAQKIIDEQSAEIKLMQGYLEEIETSERR
jgi:uncharacterized protein (DUF305 family)